MSAEPRFYYGWVIVAFTFTIQFVAIGLSYYTFSVYLKPLAELLEVDRSVISWVISVQMAVVGILSPLAGQLFMKYSIRALMIFGASCLSAGFFLLSYISEWWHVYLIFGGLVGVGSVFLGMIPCNILLANWFSGQRGRAMGISQFGLTISGTALVPAVTWIMVSYDWQTAFQVSGIAAAVIAIPLILIFAVRSPEERGLWPDGATAPPPQETATATDWNFSKAIRTRDIWYLTLAVGPCYMGIAAVILSLPAHITDIGLTALQASSVVALTTLCGAFAKPLFGFLSDFINKKIAMAIGIALQACGVSFFIFADNQTMLLIAGFFFGLGYGGMAPMWGLMLAARFGRDAFAQVMGANQPMLTPFNIIGLPAATYIYEYAGSYTPAFGLLLIGYVVALLSIYRFNLKAEVD